MWNPDVEGQQLHIPRLVLVLTSAIDTYVRNIAQVRTSVDCNQNYLSRRGPDRVRISEFFTENLGGEAEK
jgi:hypothetical protein